MQIQVIRSSVSGEPFQFATSYVVNDTVAIDAGSIGFTSLAQQRQIRHLFISHTHIDHIASLPIFLSNVYLPDAEGPSVYGSAEVIDCLRTHFFNDRVWPNVSRMSKESTYVRFVPLEADHAVVIDDLRVTPIEMNHVVPCFGFFLEQAGSAVALASDTGPTEAIWSIAGQAPHLKAVFLEAAFPSAMQWIADLALHLTPPQFLAEYRKLGRDVPIVAVHIKCGHHDEVVAELKQLGISKLIIGEPDRVYEF